MVDYIYRVQVRNCRVAGLWEFNRDYTESARLHAEC